jgi:hypothetical protein
MLKHYYKSKSSTKKHNFAGFSPLKVSANIIVAFINNLKLHLYTFNML